MIIFNYQLSSEALVVRLGTWCIRRIPFTEIESANLGYAFWNEHWTNPWPLQFITVRRKTGLIRNFVINPYYREAFSSELQSRIQK
jgi:hypothetical protein